jgi:hypothetical protein
MYLYLYLSRWQTNVQVLLKASSFLFLPLSFQKIRRIPAPSLSYNFESNSPGQVLLMVSRASRRSVIVRIMLYCRVKMALSFIQSQIPPEQYKIYIKETSWWAEMGCRWVWGEVYEVYYICTRCGVSLSVNCTLTGIYSYWAYDKTFMSMT